MTTSWRTARRWSRVADRVFVGLFILFGIFALWVLGSHEVQHPDDLFSDAPLYFSATDAWVHGGNPWEVSGSGGLLFGAPPPALLLNLPLEPFGVGVAKPFWAIAGLLGWLVTMRRLRLKPWWILFPPFWEAWLAGSPDPALLALMLLGGGAVSAVAKPYAVAAMLGTKRFGALTGAVVILLATAWVLPWGQFLSSLPLIGDTLASQSRQTSAWGDPALLVATAVGLLVLSPRLALLLLTPALWPSANLHYALFSVEAGVDSSFLALALSIPKGTPVGVVLLALTNLTTRFVSLRSQGGPETERGGQNSHRHQAGTK